MLQVNLQVSQLILQLLVYLLLLCCLLVHWICNVFDPLHSLLKDRVLLPDAKEVLDGILIVPQLQLNENLAHQLPLLLFFHVGTHHIRLKILHALVFEVAMRPSEQLRLLLETPETWINASAKQTAHSVAKHTLTGWWTSFLTSALPIKFNIILFSEILSLL